MSPTANRELSGRIERAAEQAFCLPSYDHRKPEAFHEAKSELRAELRRIAGELRKHAVIPGRPGQSGLVEIVFGKR